MPRERRQLVVDVETAALVRGRVGPIGWLVIEAIAAHAPADGGVVEVACSSRSLAEIVCVSKDSVARALRSLIGAGLVERVDHRDERSGRFASTSYRVDLAAAGITVTAVSPSTAPVPPATARPFDESIYGDQLSLLN